MSIVQRYVSVLSFVSVWVLNCVKKYQVCSSVSILTFKGRLQSGFSEMQLV